MTTKITFDTATLADAVGKAARVAPNKGPAFDRAAGLLLEVDLDNRWVMVRATDLEVSYSQKVAYTQAEGDSTVWRVPANLFAGAINSLPLGTGATVEVIHNDEDWLYVKSGNFLGKFAMLSRESFPIIPDFGIEDMIPANDFAQKAEQVAWAAEQGKQSPLAGVHVDGKNLVGCDKYALAIIPCEIPIEEAVTVPLWNLAGLLKGASDVRMRASDTKLLLSLDAETRATSSLVEGAFPNYHQLRRDSFTGKIKVNKTELKEALNRLMTLVKTERQPRLSMTFDGEGMIKQIVLDMDVPQVGRMRDTVSGQMDEFDGKFQYTFAPGKLIQAIEVIKGEALTLGFGSQDEYALKKPLYVADTNGLECYIMPIIESGNK